MEDLTKSQANTFDQFDEDEAAPVNIPATIVAPANYFSEYDNDPPPGTPEGEPAPEPAPAAPDWHKTMIDGMSIDSARDSAKALTQAEKAAPRLETPEEQASFWGAAEHALGAENALAYANTLDHIADSSGDPWWHKKADAIRRSINKDGSSYKAVYQSYKQIGGLSDLWGYTKETVGQQLGMMAPSIAGGLIGGMGGAHIGGELLGKTGARVGGVVGGIGGSMAGNVHLQISEMREALQKHGVKGPDLVNYTNMGAAVLVGLDSAFPALQAAKIGGFARKKLAEKVALKLGENLAQGGKMKTAAEFTKAFGKDLVRDTLLLEVPTELAQEGVTELGSKWLAGKGVTGGDVEKFATETAPEIVIRTIIGAGAMGAPGSAIETGRRVSDAKDAFARSQEAPDQTAITPDGQEIDAAGVAPDLRDGTPAATISAAKQPVMEDESKEPARPADEGQKAKSVLDFIREQGGVLPVGELSALEPEKTAGLVSDTGITPDEARERLIEAGYLDETGADQASVTSPADVADLIQRAISGERIVPVGDREADETYFAQENSRDAKKELFYNEEQFVTPALQQYEQETGSNVLTKAFRALNGEDRIEAIDRVRRGEDVRDVLEQMLMQEADVDMLREMVLSHGPNPAIIERIRLLIAQQEPDMLADFDELISRMPTREARPRREALLRPTDPTVGLVKGMGSRLRAIADDAQVFETALAEMERDRKILKSDVYQIATDFIGKAPKKGTRASYFAAIREAQARPAEPARMSQQEMIRQAAAAQSVEEIDAFDEQREKSRKFFVDADNKPAVEALDKLAKAMDGLRAEIARGGPKIRDMAQEIGVLGKALSAAADSPRARILTQHASMIAKQLPNAVPGQEKLAGGERNDTLAAAKMPSLPAVPVAQSATPGAIISLIDGTKHADMRKELDRRGITVDEYARQYNLDDSYLLVAPNHVARIAGPRRDQTYDQVKKEFTVGGIREAAERVAAEAAAANPQAAEATAPAQPAAPARDVDAEFFKLIAGKTPRAEWGKALGLPDAALKPLIDRAIAAGMLRRDARGVVRRVAAAREGFSPEGTLADFERIWAEPRPMEKNAQGRIVPTKAGVDDWLTRITEVANRLGVMPVPQAAVLAEKMTGRKLSSVEKRSRPQMIAAVKTRISSMADTGYKMVSLQSGDAAFVASGEIGGQQVTLTDAAIDKVKQLQGVVTRAISGILPRAVRVDVVANIEIARLAREDELLSLRSSVPDIFNTGTEDDADGLSGDRQLAGAEGDGASKRATPRGTAATRGGGTAARGATGEGRILRQESATLRSNGDIFVGRAVVSGHVDARARDAAESQPLGTSQFLAVPGFAGVVTAASPADHALLRARNAPPSEYRMATLTYRLYPEDTPFTEAHLVHDPVTRGFQGNFRAGGESYTPLIWVRVSQHMDGTWEVSNIQRIADRESAPRGMSDVIYAAIEKDLGIKLSPSGYLSPQGYAMWKKRSPGSVQWHRPSEDEQGFYISPRRVKDRLDEVGKQIRTFAAVVAADPSDTQAAQDLDAARKERGNLIKAWTKLPAEARAETPNMFSLRGFYSPVLRAAEALKQDKGSGDQFLKAILATPGVKADEVAWIGLEKFLKGKEKITKNALMAWIKAAGTKMDETVFLENPNLDIQAHITKVDEGTAFLEDVMVAGTTAHDYAPVPILKRFPRVRTVWRTGLPGDWHLLSVLHENVDEIFGFRANPETGVWEIVGTWGGMSSARHGIVGKWLDYNRVQGAQYKQHKVGGGSNYREFLLRLPELGRAVKLSPEVEEELRLIRVELTQLARDIDNSPRGGYSEATSGLRRRRDELVRREAELRAGTNAYVSKHFSDSEIAHIRTDDRVMPDGRRVLFINEVQSDYHQDARHIGYVGQEAPEARAARAEAARAEADALDKEYYAPFDVPGVDEVKVTPEREALRKKMEKAKKRAAFLAKQPARDAPFKGDLYLELALKRMLQEAIEGGYDAISWARSHQIAEAVGGEEEGMVEQYDKKIRRFYDKYTKPFGGKVGSEQGIVAENEPGFDYSKPMVEMLERGGPEALAFLDATISDLTESADVFGGNAYYGGEMVDVIEELRAAIAGGGDAFTVLAGVSPVIASDGLAIAPIDMLAGRYAMVHPRPVTNQVLPITPEMRAKIPATGQPLYSLSSGEPSRALGMTDPYAEAISIGAQAVEAEARASGRSMAEVATVAARHEALEFFLAHQIITPAEWAALQRAAVAEGWIEETGVSEAYTAQFGDQMGPRQLNELILKESVMEKYGRYRAGDYKPTGLIAKAFKRLSDFIDRLMSGVRGEGFQRWEDIFQKVDQGELRRRYEALYGTGQVTGQESAQVSEMAAQESANQPATQAMIRAGQIPDARGLAPTIGRAGPVRGITDILDSLQRTLGLTQRTGRLPLGTSSTTLGIYNGVSRTRISNDIDVIAHEAGHHLERTLRAPLRVIMVANQAELTPLATPGNPLSEGFAEFFRRYVLNPNMAAQHAPNFYRDFEDFLDANQPQMLEELQELQQAYDQFLLGDPVEQGIANQTVIRRSGNAFSRTLADVEQDGLVSTISDRLHQMYQGVVSMNHGWWMATRDLLEQISATTGQRITLNASDNPNKLIRLVSHTSAWAQQDLKEGIGLDSRPNGGGVSMHQVLARAFGGTDRSQWNERAMQEFGEYLIARRAINLYVQFRPGFRRVVRQFVAANPRLNYLMARLPTSQTPTLERPPTKESLQHQLLKLNELEQRQPQFRAAAELYYQFNKDILELLHEKHLISSDEFNRLMEDRDYAPFQRDMSSEERADGDTSASRRPGRKRDQMNKHNVYARFEGSTRDIINPIQSTVQHVYEIRLRAAINDTLRAMDRLARQAGAAGNEIFERVPAHEARAMQVNIREALTAAGVNAGMTSQDITMMLANVENNVGQNVVATLFTYEQASERGEKIIWFFENGAPVPVVLADGSLGNMMFEGLTAVGRRNMGMLVEALTWPATVVRGGVTFSFEFVFRNIFVDSIASWINSPYARPFVTQFSGMREIIAGGRYHQMYNRYAGMLGGEASQSISDQSIERDIESMRRRGFKIRRPQSMLELAKMVFQVGEFSETATRVGIFRNAMRSAIADGMTQHDAAIEAAHYAHDVMDFSQRGSKTETLRRTIPFWNAAIQGINKYARTMNAANDYNTLIGIWVRWRQGQVLSDNERRALGQAAKAWAISTVVLGGMSLLASYLGEDDEDQDEVSDQIRATHWRVSVNGILHLLPKDWKTFIAGEDGKVDASIRLPKPFEMAWFANAVERAYDVARKNDPTGFQNYLKDFWTTIAPPDSIPGLDLTYGFLTGKDLYSGRDIIPTWEKDLERAEQSGPYTTWTAQQIGKAINMSPYYVDFLVRGVGASTARDITSVIDMTASAFGANNAPAPSIEEFPIARRFTFNAARSSESLGKFYDMTSGKEGLNAWFWDTVSSDARSFNAAANTYKRMQDSGREGPALDYLEKINPDQRVFAILSADFEKSKSKLRNLHPMINAQEGISVANTLMKEVVDGTLLEGKKEERKPLDREQMRFARNELGHIRKAIAQNGLHIMGVEGWANQRQMDVDARLKTLKAGAPDVHAELMRRLNKKDFQDMKHITKVWPEVKQRVLTDRKNALLGDLAGGKVLKD